MNVHVFDQLVLHFILSVVPGANYPFVPFVISNQPPTELLADQGNLFPGLLNDFGQNSLADKLIFAGKIVVLILAVPILESVLSLIGSLIGLI